MNRPTRRCRTRQAALAQLGYLPQLEPLTRMDHPDTALSWLTVTLAHLSALRYVDKAKINLGNSPIFKADFSDIINDGQTY